MKRICFGMMLGAACLAWPAMSWAAEAPGVITIERSGDGWPRPISVSISGFSPEATSILQFDLLFMGFTNVPAGQAQFLITGREGANLEGRVLERINQRQRLGKAYSGPNRRSQVHAFADDIAVTLTERPGIAQTKIAFRVEIGGGNSEIYVADYDGHGAQAVTKDSTLTVAPNWSGKNGLLYASYKYGRPFIFSHNLSNGARNKVADNPGSNMSPAVSPDGRLVAFISSKGGSPDLYVANVDGSNSQRLTSTRGEESSPCWAPDNRTICYVSKEGGANALYTISASGGNARRIPMRGVTNPTEPDWSPDGKWIIFTSLMRDFNICIVEAKGGLAEVLTTGEDPSWAPNSRAVIFCKGVDHQKRLSLLDVPTKQVKDIARIRESNSQPNWAN